MLVIDFPIKITLLYEKMSSQIVLPASEVIPQPPYPKRPLESPIKSKTGQS